VTFQLRYGRVYTAHWAAVYSGATKKELAYWALTGLVRPSVQDAGKPGRPRLYSPDDLARLRRIVERRRQGVSLQSIRKQLA
jgi:DNA-binding transcriptional MerR regulator